MSAFLKSTLLTNRDATPKVLVDASLSGGILSETIGSVLTGASDGAGSTYKLISVPSNARLSQLKWQAQALSNSSILDVAVWYPPQIPTGGANFLAASLGGTIIGTSFFATGLTAGASNSLTEITNQASNYNIALQETPLWNVLGLTSDPELSFDLGFSVRVATGAAGYVGLRAQYQF